jgi:hypothetical protein
MDLHRIPDDLSIPEFLKRKAPGRPRTALEQAAYLDRVQAEGLDKLIEKQERKPR